MKPQAKKVTGLALGWAISFGSLGAYGDDFFPQPDPVSNAPAARLNVAGATAKPISTDLTAPKMEGKAGDKIVEVEVIKERYPNRAIKIERHVTQDAERNYVNHGTWTMWDPNGTMLGKGEFWNGKRHGKWTRWHINPSIPGDLPEGEIAEDIALSGEEFENFERPFVSEATFVDGKLVGKWTITDAENRLIRSIEFDQDLLNGRAVWYHPNGEIRRAAEYKKGVLDGELVEFTEDGDETLRANFVEGRRHAEAVKNYDTGEVLAEGWYLYAREQGDATHDFWKGSLTFAAPPKAGRDERHSKWTYYYRDGGKKCEGEFVRDIPVGLHVWWFQNGQKEVEGQFAEGKKEGRWTYWHDNGQKRAEGMYVGDIQSGSWAKWGEDGKIIAASDVPLQQQPSIFSAAPGSRMINPTTQNIQRFVPRR